MYSYVISHNFHTIILHILHLGPLFILKAVPMIVGSAIKSLPIFSRGSKDVTLAAAKVAVPVLTNGDHVMKALNIAQSTVGKSTQALLLLLAAHSLLAVAGLIISKPRYIKPDRK